VVFAQVGTVSAGPVTLIAPHLASIDLAAALLTALAAALVLWRGLALAPTLGVMALAGLATGLATGLAPGLAP